ncbi:60S ribosomal protein L35 [Fusarium oxysporum f. sp. albedinis]|nr:60S ribosomal protein L35 [Fusarium oxysporum f. sp. albedinis]
MFGSDHTQPYTLTYMSHTSLVVIEARISKFLHSYLCLMFSRSPSLTHCSSQVLHPDVAVKSPTLNSSWYKYITKLSSPKE